MPPSTRTAVADPASADNPQKQALERPKTSPYTTVNVLCLGWVYTVPETRQVHATVEQICCSYGYSFVRMPCEACSFPLNDLEAPDKSYYDFINHFDHESDKQQGNERPREEGPKQVERRLIIVLYAGNGKMEKRPNAEGKGVVAISENRILECRISDLQHAIKYYYCDSSCDILTLVNCCDGRIMTADSTIDFSAPGPDYQGPRSWRSFEEAIDSSGSLYVAFGPGRDYDFLVRLVQHMEEQREPWTIRERADRIARELRHWPGYYRKDDSGEDGRRSVVLAPLAEDKDGSGGR